MNQPTKRRPARAWLPHHDQFIRDQWATMTAADIAECLDRHVTKVSARAKRLGLPTKNPKWTSTEDAFLRITYRTKPTAWVAEQLGRTVPQCVQRAGVLGLRLAARGAAAHRV